MKFRLLLLLLFVASGMLHAQDSIPAYRNLIFSEVRMDEHHNTYAELCNMGSDTVILSEFEVGTITPWDIPYAASPNYWIRLPKKKLAPGKTFVIGTVREWYGEQAKINPEKWAGSDYTKKDMWSLADMFLHGSESPNNDPTDSITPGWQALESWNGRSCFYLEQHLSNGDSVVVDAVNGIFTGSDGKRPNADPSDVAGVVNGTREAILVRKFSVKTGTTDWEKARGVDLTDSEWLPIPRMSSGWEIGRREYWTIGNHGDFRLNATTLKSETIDIDWANNKMTVTWGVRNMDSIMNQFNHANGIAWKYQFSPSSEDSAYTSVRTGDVLTLYACGNQLDQISFDLVALPSTDTDNQVIPKNARNASGSWYTPYIVTKENPVIDTILNIAYATRVDTLFKYLEKPSQASWEIIWVDNVARPDLKSGDKLKVTSKTGVAREYYIKIEKYLPNHNANLASIAWPDIPEYYKGIFGWKGDTIPGFQPTKFNYQVQIPLDVPGIPALLAKPENLDTRVEVTRAKTLTGSVEDRTVKFLSIAEDDTTRQTYAIQFEKEKDPNNVQPYIAEPFFSQIVCREMWGNTFIEICNPGNQPLDLSRYCIVRGGSNPAQAILENSLNGNDDKGNPIWKNRYRRYVPGYKWQDQEKWEVQPSILVQDLNVNTIVSPGDVFVLGKCGNSHWKASEVDVNFTTGNNPWGIELAEDQMVAYGWVNETYYLYKITNDSVLNGLKPLNNVYDVEIIDVFGNTDWSDWYVGGRKADQNEGFTRLPQYYKGNVEAKGSFGTDVSTSEWFNCTRSYWSTLGYGWPKDVEMMADGIGSHEMVNITEYKSTIGSTAYIVSEGYSDKETLIGVKSATTVANFLSNIIKADPAQTLTVISKASGKALGESDVVSDGDVLEVVSADGKNITKYTLGVTANGLDNNAVLTSAKYTINITGATATISGFEAGTLLKTIYEGVTAPTTASLFSMFNADGSYASLQQLNFDTLYVDVVASDKIYFEVVAQDGVTKITYQLVPTSATSDAYVLSNIYGVDQTSAIISLVPEGTNVQSLFANLIPASGATIELFNKANQKRASGTVYQDDRLVVTAKDGKTQKVYYLSILSDKTVSYLAFAFSTSYSVDQWQYKISGPIGTTTTADFLSNVSSSFGATLELLNADGSKKTSNDMNEGDKLKVTSSDGKYVTTYEIIVDVSGTNTYAKGSIRLYPNPTNGMVSIDGVEYGQTIKVFNAAGSTVLNVKASAMKESVSMMNQPAGMYMVVISNDLKEVAKFKLIKK